MLEDKALMSGWLGDGVRVDCRCGGGCNALKTAQSISCARDRFWNETWRKSSNCPQVFFKVSIFIPINTECCSFLLAFQTSCPVCPPGARVDAVVRTSKRRSRGSAVQSVKLRHFGPRRSFRNRDTFLCKTCFAYPLSKEIKPHWRRFWLLPCVCAPWHVLMPVPDDLHVTRGLPAEINHVAAVNQDVALVIRSHIWRIKRMSLTRMTRWNDSLPP